MLSLKHSQGLLCFSKLIQKEALDRVYLHFGYLKHPPVSEDQIFTPHPTGQEINQ